DQNNVPQGKRRRAGTDTGSAAPGTVRTSGSGVTRTKVAARLASAPSEDVTITAGSSSRKAIGLRWDARSLIAVGLQAGIEARGRGEYGVARRRRHCPSVAAGEGAESGNLHPAVTPRSGHERSHRRC